MKLLLLFVCCVIILRLPLVKSHFGWFKLPGINFKWQNQWVQPSRNYGKYLPNSLKYERIVTSQEDIKSGVELDYRYVETTTIGKMLSSPGCPKSTSGIPWLYYKSRYGVRCHLAGSEGPCGEGQIFTPEPESRYGYCNCLCSSNGDKTGLTRDYSERLQFCNESMEKGIELGTSSELVFIPRRKQCFQIYTQAFCGEGNWLVRSGENGLRCESRPCPPNQQPYFEYEKWSCYTGLAAGSGSGSLTHSPCRNGMHDYIDHFGTCVFKVKYDFDD